MSASIFSAGQVNRSGVAIAAICAIGSCIVGVIGVMLDWTTATAGLVGSVGVAGADDRDGKISLVLALIGLVAAGLGGVRRRQSWFVVVGLAGAADLAIVLYARSNLRDLYAGMNRFGGGFFHFQTGAGLWVSIVGAGMMIASALLGIAAARSSA